MLIYFVIKKYNLISWKSRLCGLREFFNNIKIEKQSNYSSESMRRQELINERDSKRVNIKHILKYKYQPEADGSPKYDFVSESPKYDYINSPQYSRNDSPKYEKVNSPSYEMERSPSYEVINSPSYEVINSPKYEVINSPKNENKLQLQSAAKYSRSSKNQLEKYEYYPPQKEIYTLRSEPSVMQQRTPILYDYKSMGNRLAAL